MNERSLSVGSLMAGQSLVRAAGLHLLSRPLGIFMLLLIFFAFLHCWLNAFAEMLRFGDRMFYRVRPGPGLAENCSWGG